MSAADVPADSDEFVCNYCHCLTFGQPIILGRSARLACKQCAAAIVKLSICWVCGEMICRGDDCVSFGWCFWHKTCFSCLLYGSRLVVAQTTPVHANREAIATKAVDPSEAEILKPPLCAACELETTRDTYDCGDAGVVQACVDFVDTADGGMAKLRWQMVNDGPCCSTMDEKKLRARRQCDTETGNSLIWVDVADPLNGPVFRPRPLKPVPICMTRSACEMTY